MRLFPGGNVKGKTILVDWMKLTKDKLKRRGYCYKELNSCLETAKSQGELKNYQSILELTKNWQTEWKVNIKK